MKKAISTILTLAFVCTGLHANTDRRDADCDRFIATARRDALNADAQMERVRLTGERVERARTAAEPRFSDDAAELYVASAFVVEVEQMAADLVQIPFYRANQNIANGFSPLGLSGLDDVQKREILRAEAAKMLRK